MNCSEFSDFIGLSYSNSITEVFDLYGEPAEIYNHPNNSYYVWYYKYLEDFVLSISFSKRNDVIESIFLGKQDSDLVSEFLKKHDITDIRTAFLGRRIDEIVDLFGTPDIQDRNSIVYNNKTLEIEFYSPPEDEQLICRRIKVKWFYNW